VKNPSAGDSFRIVAKKAPTVPKIANLGAIQLNNGFGVEQCIEAMELIKTDIIAFHLNPLQELIQKEGNKNFSGLHKKLSIVCKELHKLGKKVIIKETGNGISLNVAKKLVQLVDCIDIGGLGGTSWAIVEGLRSKNKCAEAFKNWGIPTAEALIELKELKTEIIASGGVRSGIDVAKSIAVGATAAGIALPVLKAWHSNGKTGVKSYLKQIIEELRITMFLTGAKDIEALKKLPYKLIRNGDTSTWRI
jgi:isopentenyl-diphosphate delta-isomerase